MVTVSKKYTFLLIILAMTLMSVNQVFALDYFQKTTINANKTGTIEIRYSANSSDIGGSDVYKTLPFTENKIKAAFSSENNKIQSVNVNTKNENKVSVLVIIKFAYFGKINTASAFSNVKLTYFEKGDDISMIYELPANNQFPNDFNAVYTFILPAKEITKSSGTIKDNTIVYGLKPEKLKSGISLFANFVNSGKNLTADNNEKSSNNSSGKNDEKKTEKDEGSCGLFGIELPLILGLGYVFSRKYKKRK